MTDKEEVYALYLKLIEEGKEIQRQLNIRQVILDEIDIAEKRLEKLNEDLLGHEDNHPKGIITPYQMVLDNFSEKVKKDLGGAE